MITKAAPSFAIMCPDRSAGRRARGTGTGTKTPSVNESGISETGLIALHAYPTMGPNLIRG
ncbi:MAG: hypothetical protein OXC68_11735 [Aestuariivita sp.]|nr:hypothetical protein [Aestuariivita sp.]